jgi:hypothetical protein
MPQSRCYQIEAISQLVVNAAESVLPDCSHFPQVVVNAAEPVLPDRSHRLKLVVNAAEPVLPDNFHRPTGCERRSADVTRYWPPPLAVSTCIC